MEFYKNLKPIHLYLCSIVFIVLSNAVREKNQTIYLIFLLLGVVLFALGFSKKIKK
ncbi:hypothetical protein MCEGE10_00776 [Flavobacteriaceae bacterium]